MDYHDYPPTQQPAPKVLVTRHLPSGPLDVLRASCTVDLYDSREQMPREAFLDRIGKVDGVICQLTDIFDRQAIERGYSLRVISDVSVGYDNVDIAYARRRSIIVTHTPDVLTDATANLTWALILGITRRVVEGDRLVRRGGWKGFAFDFMLGADLAGKRLGILGMGRIGQEVAKRGRAFGMEAVYLPSPRKGQRKTPQRFPGFQASPVTFDELLATSDVLSIHLPLTPETRHMIDHRALARMKRSAYLVNVARGPVVDEAALAWALREGIISGAGLDVYEDEPNVHPDLLGLENVVLAPHLGSATVETRTAMARLAVENCIAVLFGRQPPTPVPEMRDMKPY
jgi:glyoxylate reductase